MVVLFGLFAAAAADHPVPVFDLTDRRGRPVRLVAGRPAVVVFLGADCPLANLYAPRLKALSGEFQSGAVQFLAVCPHDGADLAAFAAAHELPFPYARDAGGRVANLLGATRSPQAFVLDADRRVRYRGRIDDQYGVGGKNRGEPTRRDLAEAVREVLAGRPVTVPVTPAVGCVIHRQTAPPPTPPVTFSGDVAPILAAHCAECHRPGQIGPFPLLSFPDARSHAGTIAVVVADGTMPPWHAAPEFGRFRNERRLSPGEKHLIAEWVRTGCPEGDPAPAAAPAAAPATGWGIGAPDAVFRVPEFAVPAEGVVEYQQYVIDPGFTTDTWVRAAEVRPGNRRVVHHCTVFLCPPAGSGDDPAVFGAFGSQNIIAFTPGSGPVRFPDGMAKRIPAGWRFRVVVHYAAVGTPQTDRTEFGLQFAGPAGIRQEVVTRVLIDPDLEIPPRAANYRAERSWTADRDYLLLALLPHMHTRGKSFRYAAEYPDGSTEVLLDVPAYDFNWQHRYELAEPRRLPAGTRVRCSAVYDNSAANPANPDPAATVKAGEQTTDEMFNGYLDLAAAVPPESTPEPNRAPWREYLLAAVAVVTLGRGARLWRGPARKT